MKSITNLSLMLGRNMCQSRSVLTLSIYLFFLLSSLPVPSEVKITGKEVRSPLVTRSLTRSGRTYGTPSRPRGIGPLRDSVGGRSNHKGRELYLISPSSLLLVEGEYSFYRNRISLYNFTRNFKFIILKGKISKLREIL